MFDFVLCSDQRFLEYSEVVVCSLLRTHRSKPLSIHLFTPTGDEEQRLFDRIRKRLESAQGTLQLYAVDTSEISDIKVSEQLSSAALLRVLVPDLLPEHVTRFVYLDIDLVAIAELGELFEVDLRGKPFGASLEYGFATSRSLLENDVLRYFEELGIQTATPSYFNSGVLVVDVLEWRRCRITERVLDWCNTADFELRYGDQDALNACLGEEWTEIPPRFNCGQHVQKIFSQHADLPPELASRKDLITEARKRPAIIHYVGRKPWESDYLEKRLWAPNSLAWWREARRSDLKKLTRHTRIEICDFLIRSACYRTRYKWLIRIYWAVRGRLPRFQHSSPRT